MHTCTCTYAHTIMHIQTSHAHICTCAIGLNASVFNYFMAFLLIGSGLAHFALEGTCIMYSLWSEITFLCKITF